MMLLLLLLLFVAPQALIPPKGGIYQSFTEFDDYLSMYLTLYHTHFKVALTYKRESGWFAIAFPKDNNQYRMQGADAFIYGALPNYEDATSAKLRNFWLGHHIVEPDNRLHFSKVQLKETKVENGHTTVVFERQNEVEHGMSMSNYSDEFPMLWAHSSGSGATENWIKVHGSDNRGAVVFAIDGAHSISYATPGVIAHVLFSFISMGLLVPLGAFWDRLKFGDCKKFHLAGAAIILMIGTACGYYVNEEHFNDIHAKLAVALIGVFGVYSGIQMYRTEKDEKFSMARLAFDTILVYGMFVLTYFVFVTGVAYLAVNPFMDKLIKVLLAVFFALLCVSVCGPLVHFCRIHQESYRPVQAGGGLPTPESADDAL